jgi:hypothetical protein
MSTCQFTHHRPKAIHMFLTMVLIAFAIVLYGSYRCSTPAFEDPFTESIIDRHPWNKYIDGWGLLHFWFFLWLAYHYPNCWKELIFFGIMWEILESVFKERPFYLTKCDSSKDGWWYGRWQDIVMNSLGLCAGLLLREKGVSKHVPNLLLIVIILWQVTLQQYRNAIRTTNKQTNQSENNE